jgi:hypothetical protein
MMMINGVPKHACMTIVEAGDAVFQIHRQISGGAVIKKVKDIEHEYESTGGG